jgi:succinyl-diaminopimelate desuccinylase
MNPSEGMEKWLQDMTVFETTADNPDEIAKNLGYIAGVFSSPKYNVEWYEDESKESLVITYEGIENPDLMLHGHIDVVSAEEEGMFEPSIEDGALYGRGTADMKGGIAALIQIMQDFEDQKPSIGLMIVSDEEIGGFNGAKYLIDEHKFRPELVVSAEPNNNTDNYMDIFAEQKGIFRPKLTYSGQESEKTSKEALPLELNYHGKSSHAARPEKGENAFLEIISAIKHIEDKFDIEAEISELEAHNNLNKKDDTNRLANHAKAKINIYNEEVEEEDIIKTIENYENIHIEAKHTGSESIADSASRELAETLEHLKEKSKTYSEDDFRTTFTPSTVEINSGKSLIQLDIRYDKSFKPDDIRNTIEEMENIQLLDKDPENSPVLEEPMLNTDKENKQVQLLQKAANKAIDEEVTITRKPPASDARHFQRVEQEIPAVVFGPVGYEAHNKEEHLELDSLEDYRNALRRFIELRF